MATRLTLQQIKDLKAAGKIRDYQELTPTQGAGSPRPGKVVAKHFKKKSKAKDFIALYLLGYCQQLHLQLIEEHPFHPSRKFRFDWAIISHKIAIEFDGGIFDRNGSHTAASKIKQDSEKINTAQAMGWRVFRYHALNYKSIAQDIPAAIGKKI